MSFRLIPFRCSTPLRARALPAARSALAALLMGACALPAWAQVSASDAWTRATVPQQKVAGVFLKLQATADARLVEASSGAARAVEIHEMAMEGNVMKMRQIPGLDLPAGKPVDLKPGGHHLMLIDLKAPLREGEAVPLSLVVQGRDGRRESLEVKALVRPISAVGSGSSHGHPHGHAHGKGSN
jgi:copper(I)-binding protein